METQYQIIITKLVKKTAEEMVSEGDRSGRRYVNDMEYSRSVQDREYKVVKVLEAYANESEFVAIKKAAIEAM